MSNEDKNKQNLTTPDLKDYVPMSKWKDIQEEFAKKSIKTAQIEEENVRLKEELKTETRKIREEFETYKKVYNPTNQEKIKTQLYEDIKVQNIYKDVFKDSDGNLEVSKMKEKIIDKYIPYDNNVNQETREKENDTRYKIALSLINKEQVNNNNKSNNNNITNQNNNNISAEQRLNDLRNKVFQ